MYALLFIAAAAGKDVFFSQKKLFQIPALARVGFMVFGAMVVVCPILAILFGVELADPMFWVWIWIHPLFFGLALIVQMRALSMGPISKSQPVMALSIVLFTIGNALFAEKSVGSVGLIGAVIALVGMIVTSKPDGKRTLSQGMPWQMHGEFDIAKFRKVPTSDNIPADVNPTFKSFIQTANLRSMVTEAVAENWKKNLVVMSIVSLAIALYSVAMNICESGATPFSSFVTIFAGSFTILIGGFVMISVGRDLMGVLVKMSIERWKSSCVFNSVVAAILSWISLYFEKWCSEESSHTTFVFFDLIIMALYLCIVIGISGIKEKMDQEKLKREKNKRPGEADEPSLVQQLYPGVLLFSGMFVFAGVTFQTTPFPVIPFVMSMPLLGVALWDYLIRKGRRISLVRILAHLGVLVGSIMMYMTLFQIGG